MWGAPCSDEEGAFGKNSRLQDMALRPHLEVADLNLQITHSYMSCSRCRLQ